MPATFLSRRDLASLRHSESRTPVIPEAAQRLSGIHDPCIGSHGKTGVMDSGLATSSRPGMTPRLFDRLLAIRHQAHETLILVVLMMAVQQRRARIIGDEVD